MNVSGRRRQALPVLLVQLLEQGEQSPGGVGEYAFSNGQLARPLHAGCVVAGPDPRAVRQPALIRFQFLLGSCLVRLLRALLLLRLSYPGCLLFFQSLGFAASPAWSVGDLLPAILAELVLPIFKQSEPVGVAASGDDVFVGDDGGRRR